MHLPKTILRSYLSPGRFNDLDSRQPGFQFWAKWRLTRLDSTAIFGIPANLDTSVTILRNEDAFLLLNEKCLRITTRARLSY